MFSVKIRFIGEKKNQDWKTKIANMRVSNHEYAGVSHFFFFFPGVATSHDMNSSTNPHLDIHLMKRCLNFEVICLLCPIHRTKVSVVFVRRQPDDKTGRQKFWDKHLSQECCCPNIQLFSTFHFKWVSQNICKMKKIQIFVSKFQISLILMSMLPSFLPFTFLPYLPPKWRHFLICNFATFSPNSQIVFTFEF